MTGTTYGDSLYNCSQANIPGQDNLCAHKSSSPAYNIIYFKKHKRLKIETEILIVWQSDTIVGWQAGGLID